MNLIYVLIVGFVAGIFVSGISFLAVLIRYKFENMRLDASHRASNIRCQKSEKLRATLHKGLKDVNAENEYLKEEVERLRREKLDAWDIPDGV